MHRAKRTAVEPRREFVWRSGLHLVATDGTLTPVRARRCFPWSEPGTYVTVRNADEEEVALYENLDGLDADSRAAVERSLNDASFVLEITALVAVEEEFEIRNWNVETRHGPRTFQTKLDEWPHRMPDGAFIIRDVAGDLYRVADPKELDERSRRLLWAFAG
jgi:hypothetical protein